MNISQAIEGLTVKEIRNAVKVCLVLVEGNCTMMTACTEMLAQHGISDEFSDALVIVVEGQKQMLANLQAMLKMAEERDNGNE